MSHGGTDGLQMLTRECWLAKRIAHTGVDPFAGLSTTDSRRELVRAAIVLHDLTDQRCGRRADRSTITYAEAFETVYGEPLAATEPVQPRLIA